MGKPLRSLVHIQSYISPSELKKLDKIANLSLRSRSDTIRLILADTLDKN